MFKMIIYIKGGGRNCAPSMQCESYFLLNREDIISGRQLTSDAGRGHACTGSDCNRSRLLGIFSTKSSNDCSKKQ